VTSACATASLTALSRGAGFSLQGRDSSRPGPMLIRPSGPLGIVAAIGSGVVCGSGVYGP
jgi:hypothetical protein